MTDTSAAEAYEQFLVPFVLEPWARQVIEEAGLRPGQKVLDIGCGTGIAARLAATAVGRNGAVTAIDLDDGMLAVARRTVQGAGDAAIDWQRGDAADLPFDDARFDAVLAFEVLQFVPEKPKALAGIRRMLKPQGRLIGTLWGPLAQNPPYQAVADGLRRFVSEDAARLVPFMLGDPAIIRRLLLEAGFRQVAVEPRRIECRAPSAEAFVRWVAAGAPTMRHNLARLSEANRKALVHLVGQRLERYRKVETLRLPTMRHVFSAAAM